MKLKDQVAIVTGAGAGIGRPVLWPGTGGIARLFAQEGARVAVAECANWGQETVDLIRQAGGRAEWVRTDVSVSAEVQKMVARVCELFGPPDILVNNAAVQSEGRLWELPEDEFDRMVATNLRGYYLCAKYVIPHMIERGGGHILNIASNLAFGGLPEFAGYAATKGGIVAMSRCLALECAPYGIRVNCICPGATMTPNMERALNRFPDPEAVLRVTVEKIPAGRLGQPEDIAQLSLSLAIIAPK